MYLVTSLPYHTLLVILMFHRTNYTAQYTIESSISRHYKMFYTHYTVIRSIATATTFENRRLLAWIKELCTAAGNLYEII